MTRRHSIESYRWHFVFSIAHDMQRTCQSDIFSRNEPEPVEFAGATLWLVAERSLWWMIRQSPL